MEKEYKDRLVPVGRQLREELNRCGEHVPVSAVIDPGEGRIWKKSPSGSYLEVTVDSRKVLSTLKHYHSQLEATRKRCSESRKERI